MKSFYELLTEAINDLALYGFDSVDRVAQWVSRLREAAVRSMVPERVMLDQVTKALRGVYHVKVDRGGILNLHKGLPRFTIERVKPRLRAELDRRIFAAADLIKINRQQAIERTLQRFSGWSSSIPPGGSEAIDRRSVKREMGKSLAQVKFEERRVQIDQAHKFVSNLSEIIATDTGALAAIWHSHWRQLNYNYRKDHKERDELVYVVRGNWALAKGLMKIDGHKYTDEITKPGEEVYCRCFYQYIYNLQSLPTSMLTDAGRQALRQAA